MIPPQAKGKFGAPPAIAMRAVAADCLLKLQLDVSTGRRKAGEERQEEKARAERRLLDFIRLMWTQLEPNARFVEGWALSAMAEHLEAVTRGQIKRLVINVPPGSMKPVAVDEPVLSSRGRIPLGDVEVGDLVLTHRGRFRRVSAVHEQGELPVKRLTTWHGRTVVAAADHPFLTPRGWVQLGELDERDFVVAVVPQEDIVSRKAAAIASARPNGFEAELRADPVVSVVDAGEARCRCLTVEEDASFTVRDLAVHNSLLVNVFWPAWEWGPRRMPFVRTISASYKRELSVRDNRRMRNLIESTLYRSLWGDVFSLTSDQNQKTKFENDATGFRQALQVGTGTGDRGDRKILDDAHNVHDAESDVKREGACRWYLESWSNRENNPDTAEVLVGQRVHSDDIYSLVLQNDLGFEQLVIPMRYEAARPEKTILVPSTIGYRDPRTTQGELMWPERFPEKYVQDLERRMSLKGGEYAVAAQMQQNPVPRGGGMMRRDRFLKLPRPLPGGVRVRGWDLASTKKKTSAWTVGVKLCILGKRIIIEDVVRDRWAPEEVETAVLAAARQDGAGVEQSLPRDPGQAGDAQALAFARLLHGFVFACTPETGDKVERARPFAAQVNAGNVTLVEGTWNDSFIAECERFPVANWKDQVDATSRAFMRAMQLATSFRESVAPEVFYPGESHA